MAVYVFDVDGTLADLEHRLGYIKNHPKNWDAFHEASRHDELILPVWYVIRALKRANHTIIIVSGRMGCDNYREILVEWLDKNAIEYDNLFMRKCNDYRSDDEVKREILYNEIIPKYGKPVAVFDDRPRVVKMWKDEGIFVFDVYQGEEDF